eukprot:Sspe_Gene.101944::Locus_76630_Transcript_1_1_Confidence_1.000_Length_1433::g.101944::m.101944
MSLRRTTPLWLRGLRQRRCLTTGCHAFSETEQKLCMHTGGSEPVAEMTKREVRYTYHTTKPNVECDPFLVKQAKLLESCKALYEEKEELSARLSRKEVEAAELQQKVAELEEVREWVRKKYKDLSEKVRAAVVSMNWGAWGTEFISDVEGALEGKAAAVQAVQRQLGVEVGEVPKVLDELRREKERKEEALGSMLLEKEQEMASLAHALRLEEGRSAASEKEIEELRAGKLECERELAFLEETLTAERDRCREVEAELSQARETMLRLNAVIEEGEWQRVADASELESYKKSAEELRARLVSELGRVEEERTTLLEENDAVARLKMELAEKEELLEEERQSLAAREGEIILDKKRLEELQRSLTTLKQSLGELKEHIRYLKRQVQAEQDELEGDKADLEKRMLEQIDDKRYILQQRKALEEEREAQGAVRRALEEERKARDEERKALEKEREALSKER